MAEKKVNIKKLAVIIVGVLVLIAAVVASVLIVKTSMGKAEEVSKSLTTSTTEAEPTTELSYVMKKVYGVDELQYKMELGRIYSEDLGIDCGLVWGTTNECIHSNAGMHKCSSLPGMRTPIDARATCPIIAGHCTTDFKGLSKLDPEKGELPEGITLTLQMKYGDYVYEVTDAYVMEADDFVFADHRASLNNFEPDTIILYTCYPFETVNYTKTKRLFVVAKLKEGVLIVDDTFGTGDYEEETIVSNLK